MHQQCKGFVSPSLTQLEETLHIIYMGYIQG